MPLPDAGTVTGVGSIAIGSSSLFTDPVPGGVWSSSSPSIATVSGSGLVTGVSGGNSTISYSVTNSCGVAVAKKTVKVFSAKPGNSDVDVSSDGGTMIRVYPNPSTGAFNIETGVAGTLSIYTIDGREIMKQSVPTGITAISLPHNITPGIYMCRFTGEDGAIMTARLVYQP